VANAACCVIRDASVMPESTLLIPSNFVFVKD
jgi:hypothetical protein